MRRNYLSPAALASALVAASIALAACGGAGGSSPPAAPAANTLLGTDASSVVSSDGKVTVSVGANALQVPVAVSIAPATPDAATSADPSYVPGTTYTYTAPDIQVPDQVLIEIESPAAVAAVVAAPWAGMSGTDRKFALALPPDYQPPPTCLVNAPSVLNGTQTAQNILINNGSPCPQAPAPGCIDVYNPNPMVHLCAPSQDVILVPTAVVCPAGYREVTGQAEFQELANAYGFGRVCQRNGDATPPTLSDGGRTTAINCQPKGGKFVCSAPKLPSGTYSVLWDKQPPPEPNFGAKSVASGTLVYRDELETGAVFNTRILASDPQGLGMAEILEVFLSLSPGGNPGTNVGKLAVNRVWQAAPSAFAGAPVTSYDSGVVQLPFGDVSNGKRRFMARVFDKAGNSTISEVKALDFFTARIGIDSFTVTPSSVQLPGGPVTLSWAVKGANSVSIDQGVGTFSVNDNPFSAATGSVVVNASGTTTFTLTATHPARTTKTATVTVTIGADVTPPTVSLAASPASVVAPGATTLTATANDLVGVSKVEFYRGSTLLGTDTVAPFTQAVSFTPADIGSVGFTAKAYDAANNSATSAVITVAVGADVTPPSVSLLANPATVLVPGSTTLLASASDNIGVTKVEFWRGATLLATTNAPPYQTSVNLGVADIGTIAFTAKAYDAQNNVTTSAVVNVLATTPSTGDTYASPSGIDAGNTTCAQASPCRSIAQAAAAAAANATVWLMNGAYDTTTQPAPIAIPAGLTLRALTPGLASIGQTIALQGSANVVGVVLRRNGFGDWGSIAASSGNVTIDGVKAVGNAVAGSGFPAVLALSGTVQATMTPGNITDYADQLTAVGQGTGIYATLAGSAWLTVNGGVFGGGRLGGADSINGAFGRGAFNMSGSSRLDLTGVTLSVDSSGVFMFGDATQLNLSASSIIAGANTGSGYGIHAAKGTPQITLVNSTISGFNYSYNLSSTGIAVGSFAQPGATATLTMSNSSVTDNNIGVFVTDSGSTASSLVWTGTNASVATNTHGGIVCRDACNIDLTGGEISDNATSNPALNFTTFHGGVWMGLATKTYQLKLRNMIVVGNQSTAGSNANSSDNSGVTMAGNSASVFNLGTGASPGTNLIQANNSSAQTSGLNVKVAAGVTVSAVGNVFAPNTQQADAQGKYKLGTSPCGTSNCNVTSGAGPNYRVTSGTLQLAQ